MNYYAYIPREDGTEPMGTQGRSLFTARSDRRAIQCAQRRLGNKFKLYRYINLYDDNTFRLVKENK